MNGKQWGEEKIMTHKYCAKSNKAENPSEPAAEVGKPERPHLIKIAN